MSAAAPIKDRLANYIPVNERLERFYEEHPNGRVMTTVLEHSAEMGFILMRAEIYREQEDALPAATGHAFENRSEGYVNKTSYIENCETSAVGRALALMGYEIKRGIASREEMQKVERMGNAPLPIKPSPEKDTLIKGVGDALRLLNDAGDEPKWGNTRFNEYLMSEFAAANIYDMGVPEIKELLKRLSLRLDILNDKSSTPNIDEMPTVPSCECGPRVRKEGTKNDKKWAGYMCPNKVKEHAPIWIDLEAEAEAQAIADEGGGPF